MTSLFSHRFAARLAVRIVIIAVVPALFSGVAAGAETPQLVVAHRFDQSHPVHQGLEQFRESLAGVVTVQVETPRSDSRSVEELRAGTLAAAVVSPAALQQTARDLAMLNLLGLWRDRAHWARALDGEPGREIAAVVERATRSAGAGLRVLGFWGGPGDTY